MTGFPDLPMPIKSMLAAEPRHQNGTAPQDRRPPFGFQEERGGSEIEDLLNAVSPDCGYDEWASALMAVHHETRGSTAGLAMVDRWSAGGAKYKGSRDVEAHWRSFRPDGGVTLATLANLARQYGADLSEIARRYRGGEHHASDDRWSSSERGSAERPSSASGEGTTDPWRSPDLSLLGTGRRPAPPFPADLLGPFWKAWCSRRAAAASAPVDYVGTSLLASAGAMLANVRWPVAGANWSEPPVLWCAVVGSPSSSKSPAMDAAFDLVRHAEERMAAGFDDVQRRHETRKQTAKAKREAWEGDVKAALKNGAVPSLLPEDAIVPDEPVRPRVRVADVTAEKLAALAAGLPRGLLLCRDELAGWFGAFDKYGGGGADRAFAIEMYGSRSYVVDRVKNPEPVRIRHLSVGVLGGVQPDKLPVIITGPDDGLASRLLWCWPDALPDFRLARETGDDRDAQAALGRLADLAMGSDEFGNPEPKRLKLTREAEGVLEEFAREMATRSHEASGIFAGALGKARGHALRLATVIEHLWWCGSPVSAEPDAISARAVEAAAGLLDAYYVPMAERVFGDAAIPADERAAMLLIRYVKRNGLTHFNARELRRDIGGPLRDAAAMDAACAALVEAGLLRGAGTRAGDTRGRTSKAYEVSAAVHRRAV